MTRLAVLFSTILVLLLGCTSPSEAHFPDGSWEGIATLDDTQFFISLRSEQQQLFVSIGEMLAADMIAENVQFKKNAWTFSVHLGTDTMQFVLSPHETDESFSGKLLYQSRSGKLVLYPGRYAPIHRKLEQPERTGDAVSLETPRGTLQGTYVRPEGNGPFPTVLIIAGSGPTDRDGNSELIVSSNDNLWHLAHQLKEAGIASLRYDKFGVGESMPEDLSLIQMTTFDDYVEDAVLWSRYLLQQDRVSTLGVLGHSEGSLIALLTARQVDLDFVVSVAGNGDPIDNQMVKQVSRINEEAAEILRQRLDQVKHAQYTLTGNLLVDSLIPLGHEAYLESWMQYDPSAILRTTETPTLVIWGDRDERLVNEDDLFSQQHMPDHITFIEIQDMGHMLRKATSDIDLERSYRDRTMELHPEFLHQIITYILQEEPHDYE